jgi:micrococcal nuclease
MKRRLFLRSVVTLGALVALLAAFIVFASPSSAEEATVLRVVDGDTVDVRVNGNQERVRILNIDTPESVDPNRPKECLSDEATAFTARLLAEGDIVSLEYDEEREDRYGRTLAHVRLADGSLVSSELARAGLGVPAVFGSNDAKIAEVDEAFLEADAARSGFFDPTQECTPAAQAAASEQALTQAMQVDPGSSVADATAATVAVAAILESQAEFRRQLESGSSLGIKAFNRAGHGTLLAEAMADITKIDQRQQAFATEAADRRAAKKAAAEKKRAEAEARRKAAGRAARDAARRAAEAAQPDPVAPKPRSGGSSNPYPGYTGPRCYAPGGKTWKPC